MALCGGLCMTENSSTPRQGNAEDRADYSSFSAQLARTDMKSLVVMVLLVFGHQIDMSHGTAC